MNLTAPRTIPPCANLCDFFVRRRFLCLCGTAATSEIAGFRRSTTTLRAQPTPCIFAIAAHTRLALPLCGCLLIVRILQAAPFVSRPEVLAFRVPAHKDREPWDTRGLGALPRLPVRPPQTKELRNGTRYVCLHNRIRHSGRRFRCAGGPERTSLLAQTSGP